MLNIAAEKTASLVILIGAPFTTLFLLTKTVTDPVNATKLFLAGGLGFALLFLFVGFNLKSKIKAFLPFTIAVIVFILGALNSVLQSESPVAQNLYGVYGRNTGFIAYLILAFIALGALNLRETLSFKKVIWGLIFAGTVNLLYCTWVLAFGDFLGWTNPYGNILGLFGNPDFISAFLGIFITALIAYACAPGQNTTFRVTSVALALIAFYEIHRSHAIQGTVVTVAGLVIVGFYLIRSQFKSHILPTAYVLISSILGIFAVFGTLQKGPFKFVYKGSISLRGTYWKSAINMGSEHPFSGVGMDAYGDWYRRARPPIALVGTPGVNVTSNASHNVVLDFFAFGGWPLFISYLIILIFGIVAILRVTIRKKKYDGIFVSLAAAWSCYQLQSIISINQIGLAIWGWLLTGALVAYEFTTRETTEQKNNATHRRGADVKNGNPGVVSPQLVAGIGAVIGLIVACPPLSADSKWRSALDSKDANKVIAALQPSYLSPADSQRYAQATQLFANSNLLPQAHQIALEALRYNPDSFDNWRNLYFLNNSTPEEKSEAITNLKRLDPLNPDVIKR
jgi:O-antigen ligase